MRILFLSQLVPFPLDAGPKIRAHYVLRHLAEAGHELTLLCFRRASDDDDAVDRMRQYCRAVHTVTIARSRVRDAVDGLRSLGSRQPFLILRDHRREMDRRLAALVREQRFEAIHADQLWMAETAARAPVGRKVLDQHNAVFLVVQRLAELARNPVTRQLLRLEAAKLAAFEQRMIACFDQTVWVSPQDRAALCGSDFEASRHAVIPIAVEPAAVGALAERRYRITFVGGLGWPPNRDGVEWLLREIWPRVLRARPEAVLTIIGARAARLPPGAARVELLDHVTDLSPYMRETAAFVVPLRAGAGVRVKILDAWSWGLPIISTTIGAEGLGAEHGLNILVGDTADEFAAAVIDVLASPALAARLGAAGRATVEMQYDWRTAYRSWDEIYH